MARQAYSEDFAVVIILSHWMAAGRFERFLVPGRVVTLGRAPSNDIVIDDQAIAPVHLTIALSSEGEIQATSGPEAETTLNAQPLVETTAVTREDRLQVAHHVIQLEALSTFPVAPERRVRRAARSVERLLALAREGDFTVLPMLHAEAERRHDDALHLMAFACAPSARSWEAITWLLERLERVRITELDAQLNVHWPDHLRRVPGHWLVAGGPRHPESWSLVRSLSVPTPWCRVLPNPAYKRVHQAPLTRMVTADPGALSALPSQLGASLPTLRLERLDSTPFDIVAHSLPEGLGHLHLGSLELSDEDVATLSRAPALASLRALDLSNNRLSWVGLTALLNSPHLEHLVSLDVSGNHLFNAESKLDPLLDARSGTPALRDIDCTLRLRGQW